LNSGEKKSINYYYLKKKKEEERERGTLFAFQYTINNLYQQSPKDRLDVLLAAIKRQKP
jgi:hypothetical protein